MAIYIIEIRRTVGAYKTVSVCYNLKEARKIFEETKKNNGFGRGRPEVLHMTEKQKKMEPFVKAWAKVGGTPHDNTIIRIREV
jgi:hypothetical protein